MEHRNNPGLQRTCGPGRLRTLLVLLALTGFLAACMGDDPDALTVTGQIEGIGADVGSRVGGRVKEVLVNEGERVEKGQALVRLESDEAQALVNGARAKLDQATATLAKLEAGARSEELRQAEAAAQRAEQQYAMAVKGARSQEIEAARETAKALRAQRDAAETEFQRLQNLYERNAVSLQSRDQAQHARDAAAAQYQAAEERLDLLVKGTRSEELAMAKASRDQALAAFDLIRNGTRREDLETARAARDAAQAELDRAMANLREMEIVAPWDAVVESMDIRPGDILKPGASVRLVDPNQLELVVYVSASALEHLTLGQQVKVMTDAPDGGPYEGTIIHFATQGEYTPRNLQTKEERVQQVFGVKLRLDSHGGKLKAGMTASVHFDLSHPPSAKGEAS
ncbi:MAG TPA: HlyD family efflux transporter periplasmic adaptor subunit [Candidatus Hydrogenedentes bacterium]|nr:HlyD family efflux transporter periplasmic adaptor subunit [Candidatus Hydrogenedentota bacterium]